MTILPGTSKTPAAKGVAAEEQRKPEFSSREVKPPVLLLSDLLRAHSTFLLHQAPSMSALFLRTKRSKFNNLLGRYWDWFLPTWNVLMHGNPANNLYRAIKIAACGELGMGVGEEERGSGEREVLEGFVGRVDGLVDVIVSKFGGGDSSRDAEKIPTEKDTQRRTKPTEPWLGSGDDPAAEDGAIFLGTGALSRKSLRDVSHWLEDLYRWGPQAYGVIDNPISNHRVKESKNRKGSTQTESSSRTWQSSRRVYAEPSHNDAPEESNRDTMNVLPPTPVDEQDPANKQLTLDGGQSKIANTSSDSTTGNKFVEYLKFGYGTHWSVSGSANKDERHGEMRATDRPPIDVGEAATKHSASGNLAETCARPADVMDVPDGSRGHYLIGLLGDLEEETEDDDPLDSGDDGHKSRLLVRTLTVELEHVDDARPLTDIGIDQGNFHNGGAASKVETQIHSKDEKLRVVVYVNRPFIFALLFDPETGSLALSNLYRSLHHQIGPLIKPLLISTSFRASKPDISGNGKGDSVTPIYDLVWDPKLLTVTSTIPNIPDPYLAYSKPRRQFLWSRMEALNTHMQIVNTRTTAIEETEKERTCKTSRGWWVVWTRVPDFGSEKGTSRRTSTSASGPHLELTKMHLDESSNGEASWPKGKEIFLIRRASDNVGGKLPSRLVSGSAGGSDSGWVSGPGRLAQGIGVDTKRYIESLLNLNG